MFVAHLVTANDEEVQQLVGPGELPQVELRPALRRADRDDGRRAHGAEPPCSWPCRLIDMAEMNRDENSVLQPRMTKVAPNDTHSGRGSGSRSDRSHSRTFASRIAPPQAISSALSRRPVSSLKCR